MGIVVLEPGGKGRGALRGLASRMMPEHATSTTSRLANLLYFGLQEPQKQELVEYLKSL